jgi:hypothetical protein
METKVTTSVVNVTSGIKKWLLAMYLYPMRARDGSAKPSTPLSYRQMRHIRKLWFYMYLETEKEAEELENAK